MDIFSTMQSLQGKSLVEILMHPMVMAAWTSVVIGAILVFAKSFPFTIYNRIKRYFTIILTIDESDNVSGFEIFDSFNKWVINNRVEWLSRSFEVDFSKKIQSGQGFQVIWYKNAIFYAWMSRREPKGQNSFKTIGRYTIMTAKWNRQKLNEMVAESCSIKEYGQIQIYESFNDCMKYDYPSYILDQKQLISPKVIKRITETFERFTSGRESYNAQTIPYKETIMLWGPPGTGKTSLIRHLCAKFNMNLILMDSNNLNESTIAKLIERSKHTNVKNVILLEDITSNQNLLKKATVRKDELGNPMVDQNLSKFLNTLDGAKPLDNVIIVMTTNHINLLDSAVYRDGRVDHRIRMEYMSFQDVINEVLLWESTDTRIPLIQSLLVEDLLSANTIMKLKHTTEQCVEKVKQIIEDNNNFMELHKNMFIEEE